MNNSIRIDHGKNKEGIDLTEVMSQLSVLSDTLDQLLTDKRAHGLTRMLPSSNEDAAFR
jgi:hypothetical protein